MARPRCSPGMRTKVGRMYRELTILQNNFNFIFSGYVCGIQFIGITGSVINLFIGIAMGNYRRMFVGICAVILAKGMFTSLAEVYSTSESVCHSFVRNPPSALMPP